MARIGPAEVMGDRNGGHGHKDTDVEGRGQDASKYHTCRAWKVHMAGSPLRRQQSFRYKGGPTSSQPLAKVSFCCAGDGPLSAIIGDRMRAGV